MVDNVEANPGIGGPVFATIEEAGVHTPVSLIAFEVDNAVVKTSTVNPIPIVQSSQPLPSGAATSAKQDTIISALSGTFKANEVYTPSAISATATVKTGAGTCGGFIVSSATTGATVTVYDNTAASGTVILAAMTVAAGTPYPLPVTFATGLHVVITGTASLTVFYN